MGTSQTEIGEGRETMPSAASGRPARRWVEQLHGPIFLAPFTPQGRPWALLATAPRCVILNAGAPLRCASRSVAFHAALGEG